MSLRQGKAYLAIPGPSTIPDEVLSAMHVAAPNIYEGSLIEGFGDIVAGLKRVACTTHDVAIYIANGHGAWEAALANVVAPGDKVLVLATGVFGHGWGEVARALGAQVETVDFGKTAGLDLNRLEQALRADPAHRIKALLVCHVDTSTSLRIDLASIRKVLDRCDHPALLMADCIASLGCDVLRMDEWGVDVVVAGSQKGLMVPPGLGFVFFGPRAAARRGQMSRVSRYWDWVPRTEPDFFYQYFCGTAPTHHLYGLRTALEMIHGEGLEAIWTRHRRLAGAVWAAVAHWGGAMELIVPDPGRRSHAVTSLRVRDGQGTALRRWVEMETGVTLGIGLGMAEPDAPDREDYFRIGHMGHVNAHMVLGCLGAIEAGLAALDIPHERGGASAAAQALANP